MPTISPQNSAPEDMDWLARSVKGVVWRLKPSDETLAFRIASDHNLDEALARILAARQVGVDEVEGYLNPALRTLMPDPYVLADMEKAALRLALAITNRETIGVFGDYDVDGVTATSLLALYLQAFDLDLKVYLPDRVADGYGPSVKAFDALRHDGASLVITVDCGASAHEPIEQACADGLDILVMDHHLMSGPPPAGAQAVVNPNRPDDLSGLTNLSAVGVTFMLLVAVNRVLREQGFFKDHPQPDLRQWLDIVALGLICDVMAVKGLTRAMIAQGLKIMTHQLDHGQGGNPGLAALAERCGVKTPASPYHLGFLIGPRINAAGRIGHANIAFDLLTTKSGEKRRALTEKLHLMNAERQAIERDVLAAAIAQVEAMALLPDVIVCAGEGWHPGVIGIVAGRIKERFDRPAVVIGFDGDEGKGSGRSITGVDLGAAISTAREKGALVAGGGHAMAAGLTINRTQLATFTENVQTALTQDVKMALQSQYTQIDAVVAPSAVTGNYARLIAQAGPFGTGNPEPVFMLENVRALYPKLVGDAHIACTLTSDGGDEARAIAFRCSDDAMGEALMSGKRLHVSGRIKVDDWRGGDAGQFQISDVAYTD